MKVSIKIIGVFCILVSTILLGRQTERGIKKKCAVLNEIYELFVFLEKEMTFHRAPIQEAFCGAAEKCRTELGAALREAAQQIGQKRGVAFREIWKAAVDDCIPVSLLDGEARTSLLDAAEALCNVDTVTQRTLLLKYSDRFLKMSREEQESCREKCLLCRRLSGAAGAFLIILLI